MLRKHSHDSQHTEETQVSQELEIIQCEFKENHKLSVFKRLKIERC